MSLREDFFFEDIPGRRREDMPLEKYLSEKQMTPMSAQTVAAVVETLTALQLPVPGPGEFFQGTDGALIFSNEYGVVIRIELQDRKNYLKIKRINDNPFVLKPLGTFFAGEAVIEICPGCLTTKDSYISLDLKSRLEKIGINYLDYGTRNTGLLPFRTEKMPDGVHVVIDRLAATTFYKKEEDVQTIFNQLGIRKDPQEVLYGELRRALSAAWPQDAKAPDKKKLEQFWRLCRQRTKDGILVAGWNADNPAGDTAENVAKSYDKKLKVTGFMLRM